ncbi:NAD(P)-binding domain-containing protein [Variovorax sp. V59]|uniref:NADPH-dependent F420 reductase n=1 Tax=unclassified Variovorax TaxID=663243 RepID=UPI0034E8ACD8
MKIGFIGAGSIGLALAKQFSNAGHDIVLSNSRGPESLADAVRSTGGKTRAGTRAEAAQADMLVLSVPWPHLDSATAGLPALDGRIVIDTMNPVEMPGFRLAELGGRTSSQVVGDHVPGARLVKIANTLPPPLLAADPRTNGGRRVLFMSGDDAQAKAEVARLFESLGFAVVDLGGLATGGAMQQFPGGPLPALNLVRQG